ncbi:hypothetical protein [uncultured Microbacterium sp.]|uniref:hypothetical protein n=1 Tax=uncultured Microbacterium sp. TaxID=191216 RepID=UPI0028DAFB6D|nr:hypothetical protein [uncultured Microbacterium sp.]
MAGLEPAAEAVSDAMLAFAFPAYSPAFLFFTVILTVLERSGQSRATATADEVHADRLIAHSIRFALMVVLSFAVLVALARPTDLALVLFAALVGFVSIIRAEVMAPPRREDPAALFRLARDRQRSAERSAVSSLGAAWRAEGTARRVIPTLLLLLGISVVLPAAVIVTTASAIWGIDDAVTVNFVLMSVILMVGPAMLVFSWLSSADKSESRRSRGWRTAFLVFLSALGTLPIASLFLSSGPAWAWVGWVILGDAAVVALCLWTPIVPGLARARRRVERLCTQKRLGKLAGHAAAARMRWEAERVPPPRAVRVLAALLRPFRAAYRLAEPTD